MNSKIFIALALVAAALLVPSAAAAQEGTDNGTAVPTTQAEESAKNATDGCDVRIDYRTRICESSFEDGRSTLVIHSTVNQTVELADMGSFAQGGDVPTKEVTLQEGRNRITLPGVKVRGDAGVAIETDRKTYAHHIETRFTLIGGPYTYRDVQVAAASGALAVALIVVIQSVRYLTGRTIEPERIA